MSLKIGLIDKQVMQHIRLNGSMANQVGKELTVKFIQAALKVPTIKNAARQYNFTSEDLCVAYATMVECLRPNPTIIAGTPMLAASLPFMEAFRIEAFMGTVYQQLTPGTPLQERRQLIVELAEAQAQAIWVAHTSARGEAPFSVDPHGTGRATSAGGCGCLVIIGFVGLAPLCYQIIKSSCPN